ncbi:DUF4240 domain-containing protein [Amycolatopsis sp.]|uniref:DUF4240 domain-containing protein n=1 Tax=Amycolatopsis sp. TaxID=37632 RepID=UPI002C4B41DA|nr:DUF4240 domain-containing protein [Amycolatopsis sp.]HVV12420.1 DUF4240 domain-containing protein [Amycolatopsis sp.]
MKERHLWRLIATAHTRAIVETLAGVRGLLGRKAAPEVIRFHRALVQAHRRAYRWDLWAAFETALGGCDTEQFLDAISWLILRGERTFRRVLADPDELARLPFQLAELSVAAGLLRAAPERLLPPHGPEEDMRVFEEAISQVFEEAISQVLGVVDPPGPPPGEPLQRDRESLRLRYPRLVARHGLAAPEPSPERR